MAVGAAEERIYAQVGTLDPQNHQHPQLQPNQIFYNAQFDIDTMGKVPRKLKICNSTYNYVRIGYPKFRYGKGTHFFVCFLEEFRVPTSPSEIN